MSFSERLLLRKNSLLPENAKALATYDVANCILPSFKYVVIKNALGTHRARDV